MARQQILYQEWDRTQWAGSAPDTRPAPEVQHGRWNKFQWVGEQGHRSQVRWPQPQEMPEGEGGLSGFRHNPGVQHWADAR